MRRHTLMETQMPYPYKVEYAVRDKGGDDLAYFDRKESAIEYAKLRGASNVTEMRHYLAEYNVVWRAGE